MSLQEDYTAFKTSTGGDVKEYIRLIWDETELEATHFEQLDFFDDFYSIKEILVDLIQNDIDGVTPFRMNMYRSFLANLENVEEQRATFEEWLNHLNAYIDLDETKREYLAKFMTRVLRGELCSTHRTPQEALNILKGHRTPVWEQAKLKLENLCGTLGI